MSSTTLSIAARLDYLGPRRIEFAGLMVNEVVLTEGKPKPRRAI